MAGGNIKRNYIYNVSFQIFSLLTPLITTPYVSRVLGADGVGTYSYIHSIATYFALFAALGLSSYGLREVSRVRDNPRRASRLFYELTIIRLVTTLLSFLAYFVFVVATGSDLKLYLATSFVILTVGADCTWFFQAMENFKSLVIRNFLVKFISIACIFLFVRTADDLIVYTVIQTGSIFLSNLVLFPQLKKWLVRVSWRRLRFARHLKETLVYFVPTIATSVYTVLDRTMIGVITQDMTENGFYEQAHKIVNILMTVITSLNVVVGVRTSYLFGQNKEEEIRGHIRDTFRFMYMISFPMCAGLIACADLFAPEFFGVEYTAVAPMLKLFAPLLFIIGTSNVLGTLYLTPSGQRARSNRAIIAGACTNLVLNLLLIPRFGGIGAVVASVLAELVISGLYLRFSHAFISAWQLLGMALRYAAFAGVMFIPTYLVGQVLPDRATTILVQIGAGAVAYALLLILCRDPAWLACKGILDKKIKRSKTE
ncbi:MAG: flippase [Clostridia bacterium]|nr:flippase [Clostridia bacterium]